MTALQGAVLALATAAGTAAVARFGARHAGVGAYLAASLVTLPFALVLAAPLAPPEEVSPERPAAISAAPSAPDRCRVAARPGDRTNSRYVVHPVNCRPPDGGRATYSLGAGQIRSSSGERLRLVPGSVAGHVERSVAGDEWVQVDGWIGRVRPPRRAIDRVLVFVGGAFLAAIKPTNDRGDVARAHGDELMRSGFSLDLPVADLPTGSLQLFGVDRGRTSAIAPDCEADPKAFGC